MDDTGKIFWYKCHVKFIGCACQAVQLEFRKFLLSCSGAQKNGIQTTYCTRNSR